MEKVNCALVELWFLGQGFHDHLDRWEFTTVGSNSIVEEN